MIAPKKPSLSELYERDETAWLEIMSQLAADGRCAEMDTVHLSEYLADMAKRDRREVASRMVTLLVHLLKWEHQPDRRSTSWRLTILEQRRELRGLLDSGTLYNHAQDILARTFADARKAAAVETGLPLSSFPTLCPWTIDALLIDEEDDDDEA